MILYTDPFIIKGIHPIMGTQTFDLTSEPGEILVKVTDEIFYHFAELRMEGGEVACESAMAIEFDKTWFLTDISIDDVDWEVYEFIRGILVYDREGYGEREAEEEAKLFVE